MVNSLRERDQTLDGVIGHHNLLKRFTYKPYDKHEIVGCINYKVFDNDRFHSERSHLLSEADNAMPINTPKTSPKNNHNWLNSVDFKQLFNILNTTDDVTIKIKTLIAMDNWTNEKNIRHSNCAEIFAKSTVLHHLIHLMEDDDIKICLYSTRIIRNITQNLDNDSIKCLLIQLRILHVIGRLINKYDSFLLLNFITSLLLNLSNLEQLRLEIAEELTFILNVKFIKSISNYTDQYMTNISFNEYYFSITLLNVLAIFRKLSSSNKHIRRILYNSKGLVTGMIFILKIWLSRYDKSLDKNHEIYSSLVVSMHKFDEQIPAYVMGFLRNISYQIDLEHANFAIKKAPLTKYAFDQPLEPNKRSYIPSESSNHSQLLPNEDYHFVNPFDHLNNSFDDSYTFSSSDDDSFDYIIQPFNLGNTFNKSLDKVKSIFKNKKNKKGNSDANENKFEMKRTNLSKINYIDAEFPLKHLITNLNMFVQLLGHFNLVLNKESIIGMFHNVMAGNWIGATILVKRITETNLLDKILNLMLIQSHDFFVIRAACLFLRNFLLNSNYSSTLGEQIIPVLLNILNNNSTEDHLLFHFEPIMNVLLVLVFECEINCCLLLEVGMLDVLLNIRKKIDIRSSNQLIKLKTEINNVLKYCFVYKECRKYLLRVGWSPPNLRIWMLFDKFLGRFACFNTLLF